MESQRIASRLSSIQPSPTLALNALAQSMQREGKDVINLTAGETDFPTPTSIKDAAKLALDKNFTRYTPAHGKPELRKRVARWFRERWGLDYAENQVTVVAGVKQGIFNLSQALLNPGDEVIIPAPYWVSYPEIVRIAGAVPRIVETKPAHGFKIDPRDVAKVINSRTRAIILNSPNNPCGAVETKENLLAIAHLLEGTDILVWSDEIYAELSYGAVPFTPFALLSPDAFSRTITMNGLSKSHAMTGWRVGFLAGNAQIINALGTLQGQSLSNIVTFVQDAAIAALDLPQIEITKMRDSLWKRRDFMVARISAIPKVLLLSPPGAFYCFPDLSAYFGKRTPAGRELKGSADMAEYLLKDYLLATVPGEPFGEDRCLRLSFAADEATLTKGCERLASALAALS